VLKNQPLSVLVKANHEGSCLRGMARSREYARPPDAHYAPPPRRTLRRPRRSPKSRRVKREIIALVGEGLKNAAIAERLFHQRSEPSENHLTSILDKLGVSDRFELAVYTFRTGRKYRETLCRAKF
jgi:DNA-binding NarL/FixJ family response regulator